MEEIPWRKNQKLQQPSPGPEKGPTPLLDNLGSSTDLPLPLCLPSEYSVLFYSVSTQSVILSN